MDADFRAVAVADEAVALFDVGLRSARDVFELHAVGGGGEESGEEVVGVGEVFRCLLGGHFAHPVAGFFRVEGEAEPPADTQPDAEEPVDGGAGVESRLGLKHFGVKRGGGAAGAENVVDKLHSAGAKFRGRAGGGLPSVEARAEEAVFAVEFGVAVEVRFRPVVALVGEGFGEGGGEVDEPAAALVSGVGLGGAAGPG